MCERCGHDAASDPLELTKVPKLSFSRSDTDRGVAVVYDERMALHSKGDGVPHPERPDRLRAILSRMLNSGLAGWFCPLVFKGLASNFLPSGCSVIG